MGGYGSGRRTNRLTADECIQIRLPDLKRLGMVKRHCMHRQVLTWRCDGRISAQLTLVSDVHCREASPRLRVTGTVYGRHIDCLIWLDSMPLPFGGERWYALCPKTDKRCTTLVLPPGRSHFASVRGWDVAYGSQRECVVHRAYRAIDKASSRLKAASKYTRRPTRERLWAKQVQKQLLIDNVIDRLVGIQGHEHA